MQTVLYARVSTNEQTITHQRAQAEAVGIHIDEAVYDEGVSGITKALAHRPQGKRLFDRLRKGDTLVVRWVDRLGRNYQDVTDTIREFMRKGVIVKTVINAMTFDGGTQDPIQQAVRDALIGFMVATAQAQAEATKEAQKAGITHAKANPDQNGRTRYRGRKPSYDAKRLETVADMLALNAGTSAIAKATGLTRQTVLRIKANPAAAQASLKIWT